MLNHSAILLVTNDGNVSNARNSSTNIAWPGRLDAYPQVVTFFESVPGLAFLHRLMLAFHLRLGGRCVGGLTRH